MRYNIIVAFFLLFHGISGFCQFNTLSPYTRYGIGRQDFGGDVQNIGLGKTAIGYRSPNSINSMNPASYTSQDTMSFIMNVSIINRYLQLINNEASDERYKFHFNNFSIGFPLTKWMKTSIGIKPYSSVGYSFLQKYEYGDLGVFYSQLEGHGGLNSFYIGDAVELFDRLSIGANLSYLFGAITQQTRLDNESTNVFETSYTTKYYARGTRFDFGIQFYQELSKNLKLTLGCIYNMNASLDAKYDVTHNNFAGQGQNIINDSLFFSNGNPVDLTIPQKLGAGVTLEIMNKVSFIFDYHQQDWTNTTFRNLNNKLLTKSNSYNLGVEFIPNKYSLKKYSDHIHYRIGAYQSNSNLNLHNHQLTEKGLTAGLGLPMMNGKTMFNVAFEYGTFGTIEDGLVREDFINLSFNLVLYDFWFIRRKFD